MEWKNFFKRIWRSDEEKDESAARANEFMSHFTFSEDGKSATAQGIPELEGLGVGKEAGEGVFVFCGRDRYDDSFVLVNTRTGKIRKLRSENGDVLVDDSEMDYERINKVLEYPQMARYKSACDYFGLHTRFEGGLGVISWQTHVDEGMSTMDEDGFGMTPDWDEYIYCVINTDFEIVLPFTPIFPLSIPKVLNAVRNEESLRENK